MTPAAETLGDLIRRRRSVRRYRPEMPPEGWIDAMVAAALQAPSPSNSQPVHFVRIASDALREKLTAALAQGHRSLAKAAAACAKRLRNRVNVYHRYCLFMHQAPVLMAVCTPRQPQKGLYGHLAEAGVLPPRPLDDADVALTAGLALDNFLLMGQSLGLATCVLTAPLVFIPDMDRLLGIDDLKVRCLVTVGYADEIPPPVARKPIHQRYRRV